MPVLPCQNSKSPDKDVGNCVHSCVGVLMRQLSRNAIRINDMNEPDQTCIQCEKKLPAFKFILQTTTMKRSKRCRKCYYNNSRKRYAQLHHKNKHTPREAPVDMKLYAMAMYAFNTTIRQGKRHEQRSNDK